MADDCFRQIGAQQYVLGGGEIGRTGRRPAAARRCSCAVPAVALALRAPAGRALRRAGGGFQVPAGQRRQQVDLPQPEGPRIAATRPRGTLRSMSCRIRARSAIEAEAGDTDGGGSVGHRVFEARWAGMAVGRTCSGYACRLNPPGVMGSGAAPGAPLSPARAGLSALRGRCRQWPIDVADGLVPCSAAARMWPAADRAAVHDRGAALHGIADAGTLRRLRERKRLLVALNDMEVESVPAQLARQANIKSTTRCAPRSRCSFRNTAAFPVPWAGKTAMRHPRIARPDFPRADRAKERAVSSGGVQFDSWML